MDDSLLSISPPRSTITTTFIHTSIRLLCSDNLPLLAPRSYLIGACGTFRDLLAVDAEMGEVGKDGIPTLRLPEKSGEVAVLLGVIDPFALDSSLKDGPSLVAFIKLADKYDLIMTPWISQRINEAFDRLSLSLSENLLVFSQAVASAAPSTSAPGISEPFERIAKWAAIKLCPTDFPSLLPSEIPCEIPAPTYHRLMSYQSQIQKTTPVYLSTWTAYAPESCDEGKRHYSSHYRCDITGQIQILVNAIKKNPPGVTVFPPERVNLAAAALKCEYCRSGLRKVVQDAEAQWTTRMMGVSLFPERD